MKSNLTDVNTSVAYNTKVRVTRKTDDNKGWVGTDGTFME